MGWFLKIVNDDRKLKTFSTIFETACSLCFDLSAGADLGGGGNANTPPPPPPPSGIQSPCRHKGSPFYNVLRYQFVVTDPKIFLKAPLAPIYTNVDGGERPKKRDFLVKIFQKVPENVFFCLF